MRHELLAAARLGLLATALLGAAADAAGQAHEPAAKAVPGSQPAAADTHAAAAVPFAAGAAARPRPLVSRITAAPKPTPTVAAAGAAATGHVATAATTAVSKPKPVVSGAAGPDPVPLAAPAPSAAPAPPAAQAAGHAAAASPAAAFPAAKPPAAKGPVRLATVHGRLAAALAAGREQQPGGPPADPQAAAVSPVRASRSAPARYAVAWPKPRWRVVWPDSERLVVAWPE